MTGLQKAANELLKKLDEAHDTAQQNIPAQNLQNQLLSKNVPPASGTSRGGVLLSDDDPQPVGVADPGTSSAASRADHVHDGGGSLPTGSPGDMFYVDATGTVVLLEMSGVPLGSALYADDVLGAQIPVWDIRNGLAGDLGGTFDAAVVTGLQGFPISTSDPTTGMMLIYDGSAYTPRTLLAADIPDLSATYQPLDADLTALAGLSSTGLATRTAANTWTQRSIAGTSNRVSVTNGNGVSGDPTLDISASYVGQTSITTLGTITAGVWQGTKIGLAYGGTNADLSATGGANQFLKQSSVGAAITVGALGAGDIPDLSATYQPLDADLSALAALSSTGLAARTAANTWAQRAITGTSNRITATNGDGVSGNPTLDIASTYAGQTTIVTLGTITSGVWGAVTIGVGFGGTGFGAYTVGDILYASGTTALSKLSDVATGNVLLSGGVATAPAWGKVDLTAHVSGVLPAANGGTNSGTYTPTYLGQATAGATTYTTQQGSWVKKGNEITVTGTIVWTAASGTGNANFSLPFAAASVTDQSFSGSCRVANVTFANGTPVILLSPGASAFILNSPATNAGSTTVAVEAAGSITFTITYFF